MNYFVHGRVHSLKSTLKPFSGLLWTLPPPKNIGPNNEITLEILPLKLLPLDNEEEDVKVPKINCLLISQ